MASKFMNIFKSKDRRVLEEMGEKYAPVAERHSSFLKTAAKVAVVIGVGAVAFFTLSGLCCTGRNHESQKKPAGISTAPLAESIANSQKTEKTELRENIISHETWTVIAGTKINLGANAGDYQQLNVPRIDPGGVVLQRPDGKIIFVSYEKPYEFCGAGCASFLMSSGQTPIYSLSASPGLSAGTAHLELTAAWQ